MSKVLVIGGGVIGLCTAYYAAEKGHEVTVIDRVEADHAGCSYGNAGMVVPSHFVPLAAPGAVALGLKWMWNPESPFWVKPRLDWDLFTWGLNFWRASNRKHVERSAPLLRDLHLASRAAFEKFAGLFDFGFVKKGLLLLCQSEHAFDEEARMATKARSLGVPAEVLDSKQTAARDPNIRMDIVGSIYFPTDCHLMPDRFMAGLKSELQKRGIKFSWNTEATGIRGENKKIISVRTSKGEFCADEFVLCAGSWTAALARQLRINLPMQPGKGYSLTLPNPRQLPTICSILTEARIAVTPMGNTLRFGGTMEMAGLNEEINPVRVRGIVKAVPKYFPGFSADDFKDVQPWQGLRPCSPDGLPYIGRSSRYQNLFIATGHAMMGLSLGPVTGQLMAQIISNEKPFISITQLDPDRYA